MFNQLYLMTQNINFKTVNHCKDCLRSYLSKQNRYHVSCGTFGDKVLRIQGSAELRDICTYHVLDRYAREGNDRGELM